MSTQDAQPVLPLADAIEIGKAAGLPMIPKSGDYPWAYADQVVCAITNAYARAALAAQQAPDGRGTDAQILKERDIARHAIVGALAAGYAGATHPGADHWLAAAHDAGVKIKALEAAQQAPTYAYPDALPPKGDSVTKVAAQQAADPWGWAIVDKHENAQAIRPLIKEFFGVSQPQEAFTAEDVAKMDREWAGLVPHSIVPLYAGHAPAPPQAEPVGLHKLVAGALFDFAGYLTTRPIPVTLGSACLASPAVELLTDWAALRGLSLDDADVMSWHKATTPPPVQPQGEMSDERVAFEAWADANVQRDYSKSDRHCMWWGWQARAALASRAVQPMSDEQWLEYLLKHATPAVLHIAAMKGGSIQSQGKWVLLQSANDLRKLVERAYGITQPQPKEGGE